MNPAAMLASTLRESRFADLSIFSHVEVCPVTVLGDGACEALPPDTPETDPAVNLWTVYLRYWPDGERGGVEWVIDWITRDAAMHFAEELRKLLPNPGPVPFSTSNCRPSTSTKGDRTDDR